MISGPRLRPRWATFLLLAVVVAACGSSTTTSAPPSTAAPATAAPTADASATVAPASSDPTNAPATPCTTTFQTGRLPSDRMVDVVVASAGSQDLVTFVFGDLSLPEPPQGPSEGELNVAIPPFTHASSGLPIDVDGEHVLEIRFTSMSLSNDLGQPTYDGDLDFRPALPALRTVVNFDMSEGHVSWLIGYDGQGCVTLSSDARSVTVAIDHPAS
ncbi:MAG: AMIN-like domain-containing (lipo)protein [Candidatus Limnocylindrales bacterium]